ncbi:MAG TPA: hypothetical protein VIJ75_21305 [Hanamia sp.]
MTENYLQVFREYSILELESIADYIRHSNKSIATAQQEFDKKFETIEDGQVVIKFDLESNDEYSKLHSIFPHFFRLSTFIGLFALFENRLIRMCKKIHERKQYRIKIDDLNGDNIIEKIYRYLKLVVNIELNDLNTYWEKIRDLQKLRNRFVHNNSNIITDTTKKLKEQKLYSIIKKFPLLEVTDYGIIFISDDDFLLDFIQLQKDYISKLIDKIDPIFRG